MHSSLFTSESLVSDRSGFSLPRVLSAPDQARCHTTHDSFAPRLVHREHGFSSSHLTLLRRHSTQDLEMVVLRAFKGNLVSGRMTDSRLHAVLLQEPAKSNCKHREHG